MFDLNAFRVILLDLDGTVYHEEEPIPGSIDFVRWLARNGRRYACLTNSPRSPRALVERLARMGVTISPEHVYTAGQAACEITLDRFGRAGVRPRVFNLAVESIHEMLEGQADFVEAPDAPCDAVIVGDPTNQYATYERQRTALALLRHGAALVGVCADRVYPSHRGIEFGSGAFCAMLAYAAAVEPIYAGKPDPVFFRKLCEKVGADPHQVLLIGDNLDSDIAGAKAMGMKTVLTLTGVTRRSDLTTLPERRRPDAVVEDLIELLP